MKNTRLTRWIGTLALAFVLGGLMLQFGSARAQYGFDPSPYAGISASMVERGGFLYIVQGNTVHKVRAKDMAVVGRTLLQPLSPLYVTSTPAPTVTATSLVQNGNQ